MTPPIRLIVFDFDGTLCDSADVKTDAFHALYLDEHGPAFAEAVRSHHLANAGISRYDKIRHVESEMIGRDPSPERVEEVARRFSELVERAVIAAPLFDGVATFLDEASAVVPLAIASATPASELRRIVEAKGIGAFFVAIEGSPSSKGEILGALAESRALDPSEIVMVGDQPSDLAGAREAGTRALIITDQAERYDAPCVASFAHAASWLAARLPREIPVHGRE